MQAIHTKYLPATNTRGSRIKATCEAGSLTIDYPHDLNGQACHRRAAEALVARLGWQYGPLLCGCLPDGSYCFVFDVEWSRD